MSGSRIARGGGVVVSALLALFTIGCPSENVGAIKQSQDVVRAFETLAVFPNYRYYLLNQENDPFGVAGLERGYWIEDPSWREVASSTTFEKGGRVGPELSRAGQAHGRLHHCGSSGKADRSLVLQPGCRGHGRTGYPKGVDYHCAATSCLNRSESTLELERCTGDRVRSTWFEWQEVQAGSMR